MAAGRSAGLNFAAIQHLFRHHSGRVIAIGRAMLAALFLLSIILDSSQPSQLAEQTYAVLLVYVAFAAALTAITWNHWWRDARLAWPAHLIDMAVFTAIVFSTDGYTSPFFLFFSLPLLSAAIRWGWRETALTAAALVLLYFAGGLLTRPEAPFEMQRFIIRSTHLVILSTMLIWFGIHQRRPGVALRLDDLSPGMAEDRDPAETALRAAMEEAGASRGALLLGPEPGGPFEGLAIDADRMDRISAARPVVTGRLSGGAALFDRGRDRLLCRTPARRQLFGRASNLFNESVARRFELSEGIIAEVRTGTSEGWLVLEQITDLSTDFIDVGSELGRAAGALIDRSTLLGAIHENAGAQARLSLARDVHDSIVQFLAGATFRVEAISRARRGGEDTEADLQELKQLLVDEQRDIRGFISAVRRRGVLGLHEAAEELKSLSVRLGQQWSIRCKVTPLGPDVLIPMRLQLDLQQLVREAVANAVRHGGASEVEVQLSSADDELRLTVLDNGRGFTLGPERRRPQQPWSLKERVDQAKGTLMLISEPGRTTVSITLPLAGPAA